MSKLEQILAKLPEMVKHKEDCTTQILYKDVYDHLVSVSYDDGEPVMTRKPMYVMGYATYSELKDDLCCCSGFSELEAAEELYDWLKTHNYVD